MTLLAACTLVRLKSETEAYDAATVLVGRVDGGIATSPVVVGAFARDAAGWRAIHQVKLHEPGGYELIVPRGDVVLFAFADRNGNGLHDPGEEAATYDGGKPVHASGSGMLSGLDMTLGEPEVPVPRVVPAPRNDTQAGALADLDDPAFAAASGVDGYWRPMSFFRARGGNIYFLESYDSAKVPVLFVHGAAGSAQDWRALIAGIDRSRYQPWLFVYPSGAAIESMSHLLYWKLLNLQVRYRFERLAVVAHSMGGLVVRRFALDHGSQFPQWRLFVSLSTPWAGEPTAEVGVKYSPAVVPSWLDMQPDGPFMRSLFGRKLPASIEYDLLFGHRGGYSLTRPNNDGTVTLASQLRQAAQAEAHQVMGFDEDHTSILHSPQVAEQLWMLLRIATEARPQPSGRVRLALQFDDDVPHAGLATLWLRAIDGGRPAITFTVLSANTNATVGPLPPGRYLASLMPDGFVAEPRRIAIEVAPGSAATLAFSLRPSGSVTGYIGDSRQRAAGSYHAPDDSVHIRSITLDGPGMHRTLLARDDSFDAALERAAAGLDSLWGAQFVFNDLPAGEYELRIDADGYREHWSRHTIVPGRPGAIAPIVLQPAP